MSLSPLCLVFVSPAGSVSNINQSSFATSMVMVGVFALALAAGCTACAVLLSRLQRRHQRKQQLQGGGVVRHGHGQGHEGAPINNQREFCVPIRNVERSGAPLLPHASVLPPPPPTSRCCAAEEIELTLPPSPAPSHPSPALKPAHLPKLDISNLEREKLNRFHYTDNHEQEA